MVKNIKSPVLEGLQRIGGGNDSAVARVFGLTRQSISAWRKFESVPRHYMRTFALLSGIELDALLEYDELMAGITFAKFSKQAKQRRDTERIARR